MNKLLNKQQGFVSIITTSLIMIITTLVVIGFSQLMQRELRQSLDRQLNSQALYAAETGINDLYNKLQLGELTKEEETECDVTDADVWPNGGVVNPSNTNNEAAYTCILYDQTPPYIEFNNGAVTTQQSKIFPIQPKSNSLNTKVGSLKFSWSGARGNTDLTTLPNNGSCPTVSSLPSSPANPGVPILRVDLMKVPLDEVVNLTALTGDSASTFFLYPKSSCGETSNEYATHFGTANKGKMIAVNCSSSLSSGYACEYEITKMQEVDDGSNRYFARIKSIYNDADVRIEGTAIGTGGGTATAMQFVGAQVTADVTGKSNDVLRRIKVQIGNPSYPIPEFVVQGLSGVCKGIEISPSNDPDPAPQATAAIDIRCQ
jgi:Tfp pilus assembly protein PilX